MKIPLIRTRRPWDLGTWLWLLNRIAGVVIIAYLIVHICVISTTRISPEAFNGVMEFLHSPGSLFLELILIIAVAAHGLNGLRHIIIDFGLAVPGQHKKLFTAAAVTCGLIAVIGLSVMWPYISGGHS